MSPVALPPAVVTMIADPAPRPSSDRPIGLAITRDADQLDIAVVASRAAPDAVVELEVSSIGSGGTTKTVQSGTARGRPPGERLLTSRIRTSNLTGWQVRLHVTIGAREYVVLDQG